MYINQTLDAAPFGSLFSSAQDLLHNMSIITQKKPGQQNMSASPTHEDLLVAVGRNRDRGAFVQLFEYFAPRIKSYLMKQGANDSEAEELVQVVMLTIWRKAEQYNPEKAAASTWIFTIARNKRIDSLRKNRRPELDPNDPALVPGTPETAHDIIVQADTAKVLSRAIQNLPKEQSDLIYKSYFEDKSHSEIAEETNLPLGTVKSRIRLALQALRKRLGKEERV